MSWEEDPFFTAHDCEYCASSLTLRGTVEVGWSPVRTAAVKGRRAARSPYECVTGPRPSAA